MIRFKIIIKVFTSVFIFCAFSCKSELKKEKIADDYKTEKTANSQKYIGNFSVTIETEATTSGIASITYTFSINGKEVLLEKTTYQEPINCIGKYTAIEKNNILELYYVGDEESCKTEDPNFKLKKEGNKFFMKGLGGEGTFNEWIEIEKK